LSETNKLLFWASKVVAKFVKSVERLEVLISCALAALKSEPKCVEPPTCRRLGDVADYLCMLEPKIVSSIRKVLDYRAKVLEALAVFESYATWKKQLLAVYVERYGSGRFKVKRVKREGGRYQVYLVFETYADSKTVVVEDPNALEQFKKYIEAKRAARATLEHYMALLRKLAKVEDPLAQKAARILRREALALRKKVRSLERFSTARKQSF
jgi:hypothetical protein